jgi:TPR repeat protein
MTYLKGLTADETDQLLLRLSQTYNESAIADIVKNQRGRVETLRRLTGGIPRTIILLFEIFAEEHNGDSFRDLEAVLDRVTPLYKHRMDDLSPMQQELVDAIALNWDAMTFEEIAAKVRMDNETVQDQLEKLTKNRIVDIVPTPAKVLLYQIAERFFNIWYLMRCGRRGDKNRVIWLVRFLQEWCSQKELIDRARRFMGVLDIGEYHPRHAFYMTEALARTGLPYDVQHSLIEKTRDFLTEKDKSLLQELSRSDRELWEEAKAYYKRDEFDQMVQTIEAIQNKDEILYAIMALLYHVMLKDYAKAEMCYLQAIEHGYERATHDLAWLYETVHQDYAKAESYYLQAIELLLHEQNFDKNDSDIKYILQFLIARENYANIYRLFQDNRFDLKERYKPIYYALMYFMQEQYPVEYFKMGGELQETVAEVIEEIKRLREEYA